MRRTTIFTILLLAACSEFNPDLTGLNGGTESGSGTESDGDSTSDSATSTSGPDMGDGSTGDGDGDTETDTGSTGDGDGFCGDGMTNGVEECDGEDLAGATCEDGDFYGGGSLACTGCELDFSGCQELLYEQKFTNGGVPAEVELVGVVPPAVALGTDTMLGACFEGGADHCVEMGPMADSQTSGFRISFNFLAPGEVRTWVAGYTEKFDVLEIQLDGGVECEYSENFLAWQECVVAVDTAGVHQLTWIYRKDGSTTEGYDTVWVDSITATNAEPQ